MPLLLYWMRRVRNLDGLNGGGWGIYSLQPVPSRWLTLLSMGTPDSLVVYRTWHCSLSSECYVSRPLGFGAVDRWSLLSSCGTRQSGAFWLCSSEFWLLHRNQCSRPLGEVDCCSVGSPDSLVNFSGCALWRPESDQFARCLGLSTEQCLVRHWLHQFLYAPNFVESFQAFFFVYLC
jgi:hypothetical protein